jgi:hypothetical protein
MNFQALDFLSAFNFVDENYAWKDFEGSFAKYLNIIQNKVTF